MTRALQVVEVHAELRAETEVTDTFIDEVSVDAPPRLLGRGRGPEGSWSAVVLRAERKVQPSF